MLIQRNLLAMNTKRNMTINNRKRSHSTEKLSSGYRINRAADDSAGLSISEKMRAQIRGLEQASNNIQDGISLVQTADGAMGEIHAMLQRIRELSVQGANDTNVDVDRRAIQEEIDQLTNNIENIANYTEFNGIQVLRGGESHYTTEKIDGTDLPDWINNIPSQLSSGSLRVSGSSTAKEYAYAVIDFSNATSANITNLVGKGFYSTCCTCDEMYSIRFTDSDEPSSKDYNPIFNINLNGTPPISTAEELVDAIISQSKDGMVHFTKFMKDPDAGGKLIIYDVREGQTSNVSYGYGVVGTGYYETTSIQEKSDVLNIQAGANSNQLIKINLPFISKKTLNLDDRGIYFLNQESASTSISVVDNAINTVSKERSHLGATYNRMEHAIANVNNTAENLTASESRIRDLDMAKGIVELSKLNILEQVAESMLAQGMKNSEGILTLLR